MSIPDIVVPAYPYEGAIYWLISESTTRHTRSHPYYASLYGLDAEKMLPRAGALVALFDRIELASADHALPDRTAYLVGDRYYNPDLRLSVSHQPNDFEWTTESNQLAEFCLNAGLLAPTLGRHPFFGTDQDLQRHFISRLVLQVRLAIRLNALLVGDAFFHSVYRVVGPHIKQFVEDVPGQLPDGLVLELNERTLEITGLEFAPASFDAFLAIRASKEISTYSAAFRNAIGIARTSADLHATLLQLMREALDSQEVSRRTSTALQTTGSVLNVVGLIPAVGVVGSVANIAADAAGRAAVARAQRHNWYLLGHEMKSVGLKQLLRANAP